MVDTFSPSFQLTFNRLQRINELRCVAPDGFNHPLNGWTELEWAGAMCGEAGEAANFAKKLSRAKLNVRGNKSGDSVDALKLKIAKECADTIIYALLTLSRVGCDADDVVTTVFNAKSDDIGWQGPRI
jgi:hypothetical protein